MTRWFRVYDDLVDDPKVQRLDPSLFKALINLWCLASANDGVLPPIDEIAFKLRMKPEKAQRVLTELTAAGLIDDDETGARPHNWDARQFMSDGLNVTSETFQGTAQKRFTGRFRNDPRDRTETEAERKTPSQGSMNSSG